MGFCWFHVGFRWFHVGFVDLQNAHLSTTLLGRTSRTTWAASASDPPVEEVGFDLNKGPVDPPACKCFRILIYRYDIKHMIYKIIYIYIFYIYNVKEALKKNPNEIRPGTTKFFFQLSTDFPSWVKSLSFQFVIRLNRVGPWQDTPLAHAPLDGDTNWVSPCWTCWTNVTNTLQWWVFLGTIIFKKAS